MTPYIVVVDANTYFADSYMNRDWYDHTSENRLKALKDATRLINSLKFKGDKTAAEQENEFPRNEEATPQAIYDACCEIAIEILRGFEPQRNRESLSVVSLSLASIRKSKDTPYMDTHLLCNIPSVTAWNLLTPYLAVNNLTLRRVD